jgi:hypothetical protein
MRKPILLIAILCVALSCNRYPDPSVKSVKDYSFNFQTYQGMKFLAGEWVSDSVRFRAVNNNSPMNDSVKVDFEVVTGGGNITIQTAYTDKNGLAYTGWKLGSGSFEQILRAKSYDLSGNFLSSTKLIEYGFKNDEWDAYPGSPDGNITKMVADTVNKVTFMIANSMLYKQGERYFEWDEIIDPVVNLPRTINIDRTGTMYISTWNGELVKSTDHGISWETCTKPFPDRPYYFYPYISNDNWVWAFAWDHPTRFSKDGGIIWNDVVSDLSSFGFGKVFRLKDGSLLFHGSNCCSLNRSFDNGLTWTKIVTPGYSIKLFVDDKDEIFIVTQENGIAIYKSTDYCSTFTSVTIVSPEWGDSDNDNYFIKWNNFYYVCIPDWGIMKSADLTHYEEFWHNSNLRDLFIDHNGVLIAKDWNMSTVYYRKNSKK